MPLSADEIRALYEDPATGLKGLTAFIHDLKGRASPSAIRSALERVEPWALNASHRAPKERKRVVVRTLDGVWGMDLADMQTYAPDNDGYRYLLVGMDILSKYMVAQPMKDKTALATRQALQAITARTGRTPKKVWTDEGSEFKGAFKSHCEAQGIVLYHTSNEGKSVYGEKAIHVLKMRIGRLWDQRGTWRYVDVLQDLVNNYNGTASKPIGMAPAQVSAANQEQVARRQYKDVDDPEARVRAQAKALTTTPKFDIGDLVRIQMLKSTFGKQSTEHTWTPELFVVSGVSLTPVLSYTLCDVKPDTGELLTPDEPLTGSFYENELAPAQAPTNWRVEIKERLTRGRVRVGWRGWPSKYDRVIPQSDLV